MGYILLLNEILSPDFIISLLNVFYLIFDFRNLITCTTFTNFDF